MPGWDTEDRHQALPPEPAAPDDGPSPREVHDARHRAALAYFETVPPYCIRAEPDGTLSLRRKRFDFRGLADPLLATRWTVLSRHADLEAAERRLRHVCGPRLFYDEDGRLARPPMERD
jgi:hypothetical protein